MNEIADTLSHDDLIEITNSSISALIKSDSLLSDLPSDVILEEIVSQIAVEHGQSITLYVSREDEPALKVIVPQNATVIELKKAIARHFEIYQSRMGSKVKISWKYIWKTYDLNYDGILLDSDYSHIEDYGVCNKVTLTYRKKRKKKKL
ncbi:hypothetical protein ABMA28_013842 [Loxostege sticticalis]|uniref:SNRNP25 ubiquitin-like domain-containing protein n=1 Tax=Loxostege sticticalis TaxID=481309 RepID=A0ABD0TJX2_LOXSC